MNKKFYLNMFAAASMLFATSCSSDELVPGSASGNMVDATFTIETPEGIGTRAVGDGTTVDKVVCAVYDDSDEKVEMTDLRQVLDLSGKKATYEIRLAKGQNYRVAFFAYNDKAGAYDVTDLKNISVKEEAILSNREDCDAFTAYVDVTANETMNAVNKNVVLYRPFAQLNLGATTADIEAARQAGVVVEKTYVRVTDVYNKFDAYNNVVAGEPRIMEFKLNYILDSTTEELTVDGTHYEYLAMNYMLVGNKDEKSLTNVTFKWETKDGKTNNPVTQYFNVPVQRNYRTNIVGSLLTNPANFNIYIDEKFDGDCYNIYEPWDGTNITEVAEIGGVYTITNGAELAWIAKQVNEKGNTFEKKTVKLANDIYLANARWIPIGNVVDYPSKTFAGTFDGNGKTIYDLNASDFTSGYASAGLFGSTTGQITQLTVNGAKVASSHYAGVICGYTSDREMLIEKCNVINATVTSTPEIVYNEGKEQYDNGDKVGGIIGYMNVTDRGVNLCVVSKTTITGYRDLGGVVGYANGTVSNSSINDVTVIVDNTHNYKNYTQPSEYHANSIIGEYAGGTVNGNSGEATLVRPKAIAQVATAAELKEILNTFGAAGAGDNVLNITTDIELADGETWTPVVVDGYNGADVIVINGNGHTIKGLTAPLFAGGFAGGSGIIINDLTIEDSEIVSTNTLGSGAFIETIDSMDKIILNNCHVKNSSITGSRTGGLIGWNSGYNNTNDGAINTYVNIKDCTVENCTITGNGTVGGIVGHAGANAWTYNTITNCEIIDCTLVSNDDSYRVGGIVGTANVGEVVINGCSVDSKTIMTQNNNGTEIARPEGQSNLYGRFVPGTTGKLQIDGVDIK